MPMLVLVLVLASMLEPLLVSMPRRRPCAMQHATQGPIVGRGIRHPARELFPGMGPSQDMRRVLRAAERARTRYPGPVGEIVARELHAFVDCGFRFDGSGLVPRVVAQLLEDDR